MNRKQKVELLHQALLLVLLLLALFSVKYLLDRQESVTAAAQKEQPEDTGESETSGEQIKEQGTDSAEQAQGESSTDAGETPKDDGTAEAASSQEQGEDENIRVLLMTSGYSGYYHDSVTLQCAQNWYKAGQEAALAAGSQAVLTTEDLQIGESACFYPENSGGTITVASITRDCGMPSYPGTLTVYREEQGLILVNELPLEEYLRYVVPSEMPASYEMEALKAQAVCARTYACRQMAGDSMEPYHADVDDSVSYQVYHNLDAQQNTDFAVLATKGKVLTSDGEPISAYFFSTSCGHTSTDDVWNAEQTESYLKSVYLDSDERKSLDSEEVFAAFITSSDTETYDSQEPWYRWEVTLPLDYLNGQFSSYGIGDITGIQVAERGEGGAVAQLEVTGTKGKTVLENEYTIRETLSAKGYTITRKDGSTVDSMTLLPSAYFICTPVEENGTVSGYRFQGGGYGHGVGMSQNGANQMAKEGKSWKEILNFFYQNISIDDRPKLDVA